MSIRIKKILKIRLVRNVKGNAGASGIQNAGVQDEKPPNGRTKRWIDFTATALTHFVDAAVPRQSRANWGAIGLDNTEVFKVLS